MRFKRLILLSICLIILFVVSCAYAQEEQTVLKPNQLVTFSLAPKQEKVFVLQMKKGDFADIQSLAREGLNLSFEIYDSARKELLEKSGEGNNSIWFVAQADGNFILVSKLAKEQYPEISDAQKISIQYNNKFKLPSGTKLKGIRKVKGFDVKIMATPASDQGGIGETVLLIEKNGQLQKAISTSGNGEFMGYSFADGLYVYSKDEIYVYSDGSAKTKRDVQLIKTTADIIKRKIKANYGSGEVYFSDKLPDIVIGYSSGGRVGNSTSFIELGDTVKISEPDSLSFVGIGKDPKGGLFFEASDSPFAFWFTTGCMACARPPSTKAIWEFRNGNLRPNFDLMKKPPPAFAVLKSKAQKFRNQLSLDSYRGAKDLNAIETDLEGNLLEDPGLFSKEYLDNESAPYVSPFWDEMIDLFYTGNEELAWQFLDLVWSPQKQGKQLFIRDFKNQLLQSPTWQMILEDKRDSNAVVTDNLSTGTIAKGTIIKNSIGMELVYIPPGSFVMGSSDADISQMVELAGMVKEGLAIQKPQRNVTIGKGFWMGRFEVTQEQWKQVMGNNPSKFAGCGNCPVEQITWDDAKYFIRKLNQIDSKMEYSLPSEAQWEYAARGGTTGLYAGNLEEMGWYIGNSGGKTHPVGLKSPNDFGLYDIQGNVLEFCEDIYSKNYENLPIDGTANISNGVSGLRVMRGGCWHCTYWSLVSSFRFFDTPDHSDDGDGFRIIARMK